MKKLIVIVLMGLPFALIAKFLPTSPFDFHFLMGWIGGLTIMTYLWVSKEK